MAELHLPSLVDRFEPPKGYRGSFGWIIGYSADAHFLNAAAERFVGETNSQRRYMGRIRLAAMLDPGTPQITPLETPGVLHLLYRKPPHPFQLLHAKVAILGYRCEDNPDHWCVRLIVSTGNWTRQTLEESLDLVWTVAAEPDEFGVPKDPQVCADVIEAWDLVAWLRERFDTRALKSSSTALDVEELNAWMRRVRRQAVGKPRFFDSRRATLLEQIPELVKHHAGEGARNNLHLGSGFYEQGGAEVPMLPEVPRRIVVSLQDEGLLTKEPEISLTVNPDSCQAIAEAHAAIEAENWDIREPWIAPEFQNKPRSLHAKFIFSASYRKNSDKCLQAWAYLGSGNLTNAGFLRRMSAQRGNLEAGVVFAPEDLTWGEETVEIDGRKSILPLRWDRAVEPSVLQPGDPMPDRPEPTYAPPVAWLEWKPRDRDGGWLSIPKSAQPDAQLSEGFNVLDDDAQPCARDGEYFIWRGAEPAEVRIIWGASKSAVVPVCDRFGMLARGPMPNLEIDVAIRQLLSFPQPPEDDEAEDDDVASQTGTSSMGQGGGAGSTAQSPIRQMMELIEGIAGRQTMLSAAQWQHWLIRLGSTLHQMQDDRTVAAFRDLGLNPLAPLMEAPFRPDFAANADTEHGRTYERVVGNIAEIWRVDGLAGLGEVK